MREQIRIKTGAVALILTCLPLFAQRQEIRFERISLEKGLPQTSVLHLVQDHEGFIWQGTRDGLYRYDGYRFTPFLHDPRDPGAISDNLIWSLFVDRDGVVWAGTVAGLNRLDPETDRFTVFLHHADQPDSLSHNVVRSIFQDRAGVMWIGTLDGLNRYDRETETFRIYRHDAAEPTTLSDNRVMYIEEDNAGHLWVGTQKGLNLFDRETGKTQPYFMGGHALDTFKIADLIADPNGWLWIGTDGNGLFRIHLETRQILQYTAGPAPDHLLSNEITALRLDPDNDLWIGTIAGLNVRRAHADVFEAYQHDPTDSQTLSQNLVTSILRDRSGLVWVATTNGLNKHNPTSVQFKNYRQDAQRPAASLSDDSVYCVYEDRDGMLWVGTDSGLNYMNRATGAVRIYRKGERGLEDDTVFAILEDRVGAIWLATDDKGIYRYDRATDSFSGYAHDPANHESLSHNYVRVLLEDRDGMIWAGTQDGGLNRLDPRSGKFLHFRNDPADPRSLSNDRIFSLFEDREGRLWVGTFGDGLNLMDRETGAFTRFKNDPGDSESLSHNVVTAIHQDAAGVLWVATQGGGLNKMVPKSDGGFRFIVYSVVNGLASSGIRGILEGGDGRLWLNTTRGISRFDPKSETFRNFDSRDGVQAESYYGAYHLNRAGEMFFGGQRGLTVFHPKNLAEDTYVPPVVLTDFQIFNQSARVRAVDPKSPLEKNIRSTESLTLSYLQSVFSFEFAALHFADPAGNRYSYRLEGFDERWHETDAGKRFATYTNLDAGGYVFKLKGRSKHGPWSEEPTSIRIRILPPPWKTWWAYSLYALVLISLVAAYLRAQAGKLEKERRLAQKERAVVARLRQVDKLKDEFMANTSHELRTPLNGIIGLAESLIDGVAGPLPDKGIANLSMIVSSGRRLSSLVNDILDFSKLAESRMSLRKQPVDLRALVDVVINLSKPLVDHKQLELVNRIPADAPSAFADEDRLQQIFHNLIGNAIKFTDSGTIAVSVEPIEDWLHIRVSDTGIGIPEDKFEQIFKPFEQAEGSTERIYGGTGLGLAVTKQLVTLHGGEIVVASKPGEGSVFSFTLPISRERAVARSPEHEVSTVRAMGPSQPESQGKSPEPNVSEPDGFRILVVDDEPINRQVLADYLLLKNHEIVEAASGMEALELLKERGPFDMILLDIMMPRMSGYEVCKEIRARYPVHELPILFLTAKNQVEDLVVGFTAGANDYITKPISKDELYSRVKTHLQLMDINRTLEQKVAKRTQNLKMKNEELETLNEIVKTINREIKLDRVLQTMLEQGIALIAQAEKGTFILWDSETRRFRFAASVGHDFEMLRTRTFTRSELVRHYMQGTREIKQGVYLVRQFEDQVSLERFQDLPKPKALLAMTVMLSGEIQGFLVLDNYTDSEAFNKSDVQKLERLREHAVSAVAKAHFLKELQEKNEKILRTQNHLIMQEKMASLGTLTAGIAHEIKNPLNLINNFAWLSGELVEELNQELRETAGRQPPETVAEGLTELKQNVGLIHEHGERANQIVQSMMTLARDEPGERLDTQINSLVEKYVTIAYHGLKAKHPEQVNIGINLDPSVGKLRVTPRDLTRVMINLIHNAFEAVVEKKAAHPEWDAKIEVWTKDQGPAIEIGIRDNGVGIAEQHHEQIFTPFFTTKPTGKGNIGLGLSICYDIVVREHAGEIKLNTELGSFTEFTLVLPRN